MKSLGAVSVALFLCSCGGKQPDELFAEKYCALIAPCCDQAGLPIDPLVCQAWRGKPSEKSVYDPVFGNACLAELRAAIEAGTFCARTDPSSIPSCVLVFGSPGGRGKPGDDSLWDDDCAKSSAGKTVCASALVHETQIMKCQVQIAGAVGSKPCVGTQDGNAFNDYYPPDATGVLEQGYVCDTAAGIICQDGACVALVPAGASCQSSEDCVRTTHCSSSQSLCVAPEDVGGPCLADADCVASAYCDTSFKQCRGKLAKDTACDYAAQCFSGFCSQATCQWNPGAGLIQSCGQ